MHYGFLDESGILEKKTKEGGYFVISVVVVADPGELKNVMKIARRGVPGKYRARGVFKASHAHPALIRAVLKELAKRRVGVVIGIWDKRKKNSRINRNVAYRRLVAKTVVMTLKIYPRLDLIIHKRYTNPKLQRRLRDELTQRAVSVGGFLTVDQLTERQRGELELADAVAWAVFQKYNRSRGEFYEIIRRKIKKESRLAA